MKTVKIDVTYVEKAGRWELLIRFLWSIPSYIVMAVFSIIASIVMVAQFLHILVLGKRNKALHDIILKYMVYSTEWQIYVALLTDERNPLMPEN